jgi:hypothetical protein
MNAARLSLLGSMLAAVSKLVWMYRRGRSDEDDDLALHVLVGVIT